MIGAIVALALQAISLGTGIWSASIPQEQQDVSTRENDVYGNISRAGYLPGAAAGIESDINTTSYFEDSKLKKGLATTSQITGGLGSIIGAASSSGAFGGKTGDPVS